MAEGPGGQAGWIARPERDVAAGGACLPGRSPAGGGRWAIGGLVVAFVKNNGSSATGSASELHGVIAQLLVLRLVRRRRRRRAAHLLMQACT
jgi:hypothetical protein